MEANLLKVSEIVPFLRKKTVHFSDEVELSSRERGLGTSLLPSGRRPLTQVTRSRHCRLPAAPLLCMAVPAIYLFTLLLTSLAPGDGVTSLPQHSTYAEWLSQHGDSDGEDPEVLFRGDRLRYNTSALVHVRWPGDSDCERYVVRFVRNQQLPAVALVSLPGSGATWLRYLIEGATGVFTGSVHHDPLLFQKGFLGELTTETDGSTIVQQTHRGAHVGDRQPDRTGHAADFEQKAPKAVLLLRDPYRALIHARSLEAGDREQLAPSSQFRGDSWARFVRFELGRWLFRVQMTLGLSEGLHLVHFEDLKADTDGQLLPLLEFLEVSAPLSRRRCLRAHPEGLTRRDTDAGVVTEFAFREPQLRQLVDDHIDQLQELLRDHGHALPLQRYPLYDRRRLQRT